MRGNRAVRDHAIDGRDLHLFEKVPPAHLRYRGQFVCAGHETVPGVPDVNGSPRNAIAFQLVPAVGDDADEQTAAAEIAGLSLEELRRAALSAPSEGDTSTEAKRKTYKRSAAVRPMSWLAPGEPARGAPLRRRSSHLPAIPISSRTTPVASPTAAPIILPP